MNKSCLVRRSCEKSSARQKGCFELLVELIDDSALHLVLVSHFEIFFTMHMLIGRVLGCLALRPSVRPVPLEVHIQGYPGKFYCPRMATMNKPTYAAITRYARFSFLYSSFMYFNVD